jgi:predicted enzyme related to lactoylglutathione lyase
MQRPAIAWGEVTVDCLDTARVAVFWGELLDAPTEQQKSGWFRVGPLVAGQLGGHRLGEMGADPEGVGFVMADPEGNEFCLVALPP